MDVIKKSLQQQFNKGMKIKFTGRLVRLPACSPAIVSPEQKDDSPDNQENEKILRHSSNLKLVLDLSDREKSR